MGRHSTRRAASKEAKENVKPYNEMTLTKKREAAAAAHSSNEEERCKD